MQTAKTSSLNLWTATLLLLMLSAAAIPALGQQNPGVIVGGTRITNSVDDWSHHRLVFTNPGTADEAIKNGTYDKWLKVVNEPRYVMQQLKKNAPVQGPAASDVAYLYAHAHDGQSKPKSKGKGPVTTLDKDWSMSLGPTGALLINQYPAKFTFDTTNPGGCSDYVVYPTGLGGTATQATIVGYTSIYGTTTCPSGPSNGGPDVAWAYYLSTATVTSALSPVISIDGSQVAFITTSGGVASLVLLKPAAGTGTVAAPTSLTPVAPSAYRACVAPCATTIAYGNGHTDTNSAPFYVYYGTAADDIFVGDDTGGLHEFTGVFNGATPAETNTGGWPITLGTTKVTSPVLDPITGLVFAGDAGGILYSVTSTGTPTKVTSARIAFNTAGIADSPIVDVTGATSSVYVFSGCNTTGCGGSSAVFKYPTATPITTAGTSVLLGTSAVATTVYDGAFDNTHETGAGTTGDMYVCGYHVGGAQPRLFQIPMVFTNGSTANTVDTPSTAAGTCGPVTEFLSTKTPTTLNGALTAAATSVPVTSAADIAVGDYIYVDTESMHVTGIATNTLTVTRAALGSTAATHLTLAPVTDDPDFIFMGITAGGFSITGCTTGSVYL